jgi:hypothetical protein
MTQSESAILIINDTQSAYDILRTISQNARAFTNHPIRILRGDNPAHKDIILSLVKRFQIREAPSLIVRGGSVVTGRAKVCEFIPRLVRDINMGASGRGGSGGSRMVAPVTEETFYTHQLHVSEEMDRAGADDEETQPGEEITQRIDRYRQEMAKRNAGILHAPDPDAPAAARPHGPNDPPTMGPPAARRPQSIVAAAAAAASAEGSEGSGPSGTRRASRRPPEQTQMPIPRAPPSAGDVDEKFAARFREMQEETPM